MDSTEYSTNGNDYQQQSNATDQSMSQTSDGKSSGKPGEQIYASKDQDDNRKLFVGGLSWHTNEESLAKYFSQYGEVTDCEIKKDPGSGKSRGFGFVLFAKDESASSVLDASDHKLDGKSIDPKYAVKLKKPEKKKKIFIGGLGADVKDEHVHEYFSQFGKVVEKEFPEEKNTKRRLGFCFVTFETPEEAQAAQKQRYHTIGNKKVEVSEAVTREERQAQKMRSFGMGMGMRGGARGRGGYGPPGPGYKGGYGGYAGYEEHPGFYGPYNHGHGHGPGSYGGSGYGGYGGNPGYQGGYGGGGYSGGGGGYDGGYPGGSGHNQTYGGYGDYSGGPGGNYGGGYSGGHGGGYGNYGGGYHSGYEQSGHGKAPVNRRGGGAQHHPYSR